MTESESRDLARLLTRLLREPPTALHPEWRRGANLLLSSRPDATGVLLRRVVELEAALAAGPTAAVVDPLVPSPLAPPVPNAPRSVLRDAGVVAAGVAAGVVGGGLVLGALDAAFDLDDDLSGLLD
jgi:hypothetical protein